MAAGRRAEQRDVGRAGALRGGALLLGAGDWLAAHRPDRVVVVGRPTLSRPVSALLADPAVRVETVPSSPRWADAGRNSASWPRQRGPRSPPATGVGGGLAATPPRRVGRAIDAVLDAAPELTAARLARDAVAALPSGRAAGAGLLHAGPRRRPAGGAPAPTSPCWPTAASQASTARSRRRSAPRSSTAVRRSR